MSKVRAGMLFFSVAVFFVLADGPPQDLVEYIRQAKKLSISESQIRQNVQAAGWDAKLIEQALSAVNKPVVPSANGPAVLPDGYRIGPGDMLQISVYKEPEASVPSAVVRADGKISLPLIKEVSIAGLTPVEAENALTTRFSRFIESPDVTVIISHVRSQKIYLVGGVRSVKPIELTGRMTVLQAITEAGGLTDYAKRKKIYILRNDNGKQVRLPFDYDAVIKGEKMDQNIMLLPDDTIVVPQ
jgi:polysaccharide export outer membrane protein